MSNFIIKNISSIPITIFVFILILPVVLFFTFEELFLIFYFFIFIYLVYKVIVLVIFSVVGIFKYKQSEKTNYLELIQDSNIPNHLIAIAVYKEKYKTIKETLDSILKQDYPKNKIEISISFEERHLKHSPGYVKTIELVKNYARKNHLNIYIFIHPSDLKYEVPGAASNKSWAVTSFLSNSKIKNVENYIVTIPDADTCFSEKYFSNLAYKWLNSKQKHQIFIQPALYKFQNNFFKLRSFTRIISTTLTLSILSSSAYKSRNRYTFSCFSLSLSTLIKSNFWLTSISIDDTPFYWRPYSLFDGNWKCEVIYSPISVNAIYNKSFFENIFTQYQQFYRWGWGIITIPIALRSILKNQNIKLLKKIRDCFTLFDNFILAKIALPSLIICTFLYSNFYSEIISKYIIEVDILIAAIPITIILRSLIIPYKNLFSYTVKLIEDMLFVLPIGIINVLAFGFLPYFHAYLDYAKNYKHHEKITWSEKN